MESKTYMDRSPRQKCCQIEAAVWYGASVLAVLSKGPLHLVLLNDKDGGTEEIFLPGFEDDGQNTSSEERHLLLMGAKCPLTSYNMTQIVTMEQCKLQL